MRPEVCHLAMAHQLLSSKASSLAGHGHRAQPWSTSRASQVHAVSSRAVLTRATDDSRPSCSPACSADVDSQEIAIVTRRQGLVFAASALALAASTPSSASAAGFKKELKKRKLTPEDYVENEGVGLGIYELEEGKGDPIQLGDRVVVHFDCLYRGIDVVSSRSARLLGGNRTIAEPYEFVVGEPVSSSSIKQAFEGGGGLYAGVQGPKPPQALSKAVVGMRRGGKRSILVNKPELGYPKGEQEIPEGATFELKVEVLDVPARKA